MANDLDRCGTGRIEPLVNPQWDFRQLGRCSAVERYEIVTGVGRGDEHPVGPFQRPESRQVVREPGLAARQESCKTRRGNVEDRGDQSPGRPGWHEIIRRMIKLGPKVAERECYPKHAEGMESWRSDRSQAKTRSAGKRRQIVATIRGPGIDKHVERMVSNRGEAPRQIVGVAGNSRKVILNETPVKHDPHWPS